MMPTIYTLLVILLIAFLGFLIAAFYALKELDKVLVEIQEKN